MSIAICSSSWSPIISRSTGRRDFSFFVRDNHSYSSEAPFVGCTPSSDPRETAARGEIFDVAVDIRKVSPFARWVGIKLSSENKLSVMSRLVLRTDSLFSAPRLSSSTSVPTITIPRTRLACFGMIRR
jgi:hypothetical protein